MMIQKSSDETLVPAPLDNTYDALVEKLATLSQPGLKISEILFFMRFSLSKEGGFRLGDFWKARRLCLPLFKEKVAASERLSLWNDYVELSREADHLKNSLEEQSLFAVEQIELALKDLEESVAQFPALVERAEAISTPAFFQEEMEQKRDAYAEMQKEAFLLQTFISRLQSLRSEVMKTAMRLKIKNQLFQRLSVCGDFLFSKRKSVVESISSQFAADVERFVQAYFGEELKKSPYYVLKDEIKAFQEMAKLLSLQPRTFSEIRLGLSRCWDDIKVKEKERKKELEQKKEVYKQNFDKMQEQMNIKREKDRLRQEKEDQKEKFMQQLKDLLQAIDALSIEEIEEQKKRFFAEKQSHTFTSAEGQWLDSFVQQLDVATSAKEEEALLAKTDGEELKLALAELLQKRETQRLLSKNNLEEYRKELGKSGYDFEKAMELQERLETERERLLNLEDSIERLFKKLEQL